MSTNTNQSSPTMSTTKMSTTVDEEAQSSNNRVNKKFSLVNLYVFDFVCIRCIKCLHVLLV